MKLNEFERWLDEVEKESMSVPLDKDTAEHLKNLLHNKIASGSNASNFDDLNNIDVDKFLESFHPDQERTTWQKKKKFSDHYSNEVGHPHRARITGVIAACAILLSISASTYATVSRYFGVHKSTPELDKQLDVPNETQMALDQAINGDSYVIQNKYEHTQILDESFFDNPSFYNTVTDVTLDTNSNNIYTTEDFIFNYYDVAALKKENNESWHLAQGEHLEITLAIDTSFAGSEEDGEYIEVAYITNGQYIPFRRQKITDAPTTIAFTAPQTGEYYFGIANMSLSYIKITELKIA